MTPCCTAIHTAWRHIHDRTLADATLAEFTACLHDPQVQDAEAHVNAVALTGDMLATRAACQRWNDVWRSALKQMRSQQEAA